MSATTGRSRVGELLGIVAGLTIAIGLMLLAFVTPSINSGAHDLPLAVGGPAEATQPLIAALEEQSPGTFDVTTYDSADEVSDAITDRDAIGGISAGPDGITVHTAAAAGTPYAGLLRNVGAGMQAAGQQVTYVEEAPLPDDDPAGVALSTLGLPMIFGGMASAALLSIRLKRAPALRVVGALAFSVLAAMLATGVLQYGFDALSGSYWANAGVLALGIAAISLTVLGLESVLGFPGLGLGAIIMLFVANPLSGFASGPHWLPQPWGEIGQYLPLGAAGTALRSTAFFDGAGAGRALIVLACWVAVGLLLSVLPGRRTHQAEPEPETRPTSEPAAV